MFNLQSESMNEICIICLEGCEDSFACCNGYINRECLLTYITSFDFEEMGNLRCPHCRHLWEGNDEEQYFLQTPGNDVEIAGYGIDEDLVDQGELGNEEGENGIDENQDDTFRLEDEVGYPNVYFDLDLGEMVIDYTQIEFETIPNVRVGMINGHLESVEWENVEGDEDEIQFSE